MPTTSSTSIALDSSASSNSSNSTPRDDMPHVRSPVALAARPIWSALGWKRAGEGEAALDPDVELAARHIGRVEPQPTPHRAATHHHFLGRGRSHELLRLGRVDPHQQTALAARGDGHVAADEKGEPAEHPLLLDAAFAGDELADSGGQRLVIGHAAILTGGELRNALSEMNLSKSGNCGKI